MNVREVIEDIAFYTDGEIETNGILSIKDSRVIVLLENENWNDVNWIENIVEEIYLSKVKVLFVFKHLSLEDIIQCKILQYFVSAEPTVIMLSNKQYYNVTYTLDSKDKMQAVDIQPINKFNLYEVK